MNIMPTFDSGCSVAHAPSTTVKGKPLYRRYWEERVREV